MSTPLLLQAFEGNNETIPVWFMRQAGRYLPEYQAVRAKHTFEEMFSTPALAAEITCQPVGILGVDAAILFADILTLPAAMGARVRFDGVQGPRIERLNPADLGDFDELDHVAQAIKLVKQRLPAHVPLIGFAGSPFTVLTYLIEGGSSSNFRKTLQFMLSQPAAFRQLMEILTRNTVSYLRLQKDAGIDVFQIFDTWAGILRAPDFEALVLPYLKRIFAEVDLPSIYYARGAGHLLSLMDEINADFLSVCHTVELGSPELLRATDKGIQGNLFNALLYSDAQTLDREVDALIDRAKRHRRFIFNLSHGIMPDMDAEKLKRVVERAHAHEWTKATIKQS